ncbi:hypothetical protein AVEN_219000-1 [Araneus ventricosus]|uniref:Uncharacterized protein n=1 Tax=Araneus ventricosus TaxID=182803 RepID=A0A4Y2CBS1_ARAVE|nr:hypothetical protein AVEN_219000-1 [Araneus ventricosus]
MKWLNPGPPHPEKDHSAVKDRKVISSFFFNEELSIIMEWLKRAEIVNVKRCCNTLLRPQHAIKTRGEQPLERDSACYSGTALAYKWEPEGQIARWIQRLQEYDFEIHHRNGTSHGNADSLSRRPSKEICKHCTNAEKSSEWKQTFP